MGVRGLARYSYQNEARTSRGVAALHDVTLAVDLVGFQFHVCQEIAKQIESSCNIPASMWLLLGGCPIRLEQYVDAWLTRLDAAKITLVFVSDPPQCFLGTGHNKTLELQERAQQKTTKLRELSNSLFGATSPAPAPSSPPHGSASVAPAMPPASPERQAVDFNTDKKDLMRNFLQAAQGCFPFSREKLRSVLKRHGCVITTATREADEELAQLVRDGKAYAVLANDSDFLVMRGVQYIPFNKLRVDERRVTARVFTPELVAESLGIESAQLVDLALLCTNDYTQQLDVLFQFSDAMNFPRSPTDRSGEDVISPELAARWIVGQRLSSIMDDPRIHKMAMTFQSKFTNALGAIYEFYGYGSEFQQRYPRHEETDDRLLLEMPKTEVQKYKTLLDKYEYSSSIVDVLASKSRRLKQQFDIIAAMLNGSGGGGVSPGGPGKKSMAQLLIPVRRLLYTALGMGNSSVREYSYDPISGHHQHHDLQLPSLDFVNHLLASSSIATRSQVLVEQTWRSLVFHEVYDGRANGQLENAVTRWKLLRRGTPQYKSIVSSLLLLWKCDALHSSSSSSGNRLVEMETLDILLLAALVSMSLQKNSVPQVYDFEPQQLALDWQVYASVGAFIEILRAMHFVRIVLGEQPSPSSTQCPSLFSAEVFLPVYAIVQSTRAGPTAASPAKGNASVAVARGLTRAQVDAVLGHYAADLQANARQNMWVQFSQMRSILHYLVGVIPTSESESPVAGTATSPATASSSLRPPPVVVARGGAVLASNGNSTPMSTAASTATTSSKKQNKNKKSWTPTSKKDKNGAVASTTTATAGTATSANANANGKMVGAGNVQDVNQTPLNGSASEYISPPLPLGPPPALLPLPPSGKKKNKKKGNQQTAAATQAVVASAPSPRPSTSVKTPAAAPAAAPTPAAGQKKKDATNGAPAATTSASGPTGKSGKGNGKPPLLTPASVAKRMGKAAPTKNKNKNKPSPSPRGRASEASSASEPSSSAAVETQPPVDTTSLRGLLQRLPVYNHRHEILKNIASNQLTIIQGETGCGKSTSVPQFILDDWLRNSSDTSGPVSVFVTQPRRIAAMELAKTVAKMREQNEFQDDGIVGNVVGYRIGQKHATSNKTKITYVTTGYMVERLIHDPEALQQMTHLVIDEVHERSMDVDTLLLLLKLQLQTHDKLRIVIMSATMDAKVLLKYFTKSMATKLMNRKPLFVGTKLFPVENVFLEDLGRQYPQICGFHPLKNDFMRIQTELQKITSKRVGANSELGLHGIQNVLDSQCHLIPPLIQQLMVDHHNVQDNKKTQTTTAGGILPQCILVFLPGIGSINRVYEDLNLLFGARAHFHGISVQITVLHSTLEMEQQQIAFASISGKTTKIVLATNLAESSVTIPDVTHVINCGMEKQIQMPNARSTHAEVLVDVWCSRASVHQRTGRAGRLMKGVAFHLFSQEFYDNCMAQFTTPEILRKPLDRIVLQLKGKLHEFGVPSELLKQALDAPDLHHIDGAYKLLANYDAIDDEDEEKAQITSFGHFVCHMPLNMELCRLMLMGKNVVNSGNGKTRGYLMANMMIVVSLLASADLFLMPSWFHSQSPSKYMNEMKHNLQAKMKMDAGTWSEPLAMWLFYLEIIASTKPQQGSKAKQGKQNKQGPQAKHRLHSVLKKHQISFRRWQTLNLLISDTCTRFLAMARQGILGALDPFCMQMLMRLDGFASSQRVDTELIQFAQSHQEFVDILRFLVVHNYSDSLVQARLQDGSHFEDDGDALIATSDRVDLSIGKEDGKLFFAMPKPEREQLIAQLAKTENDIVKIVYANTEVSVYTKATAAIEQEADETEEEEGLYDAVLPRMSLPVSLAYYIRDPKFPLDFGRVLITENENGMTKSEQKIRFRVGDCSGVTMNWVQAKENGKVNIGGKSLFALPIRSAPDAINQSSKLLAVYADRLFTGDETRMFCSKCTLLPPDQVAYHLVLLLATVRGNANVWLQVDGERNEIVALKIDKQLVALPAKKALKWDVVERVNVVRQGLSMALQCGVAAGEGDHDDGEQLLKQKAAEQEMLLPVEAITSVCRDDEMVVTLTKEQARARQYDWKQLKMQVASADDKKQWRLLGHTAPRYPQFTSI